MEEYKENTYHNIIVARKKYIYLLCFASRAIADSRTALTFASELD